MCPSLEFNFLMIELIHEQRSISFDILGLGAPMGGMNLGPAPIGMGNPMGNLMGGVGGIGGIQNNPLGGIGSIGGLGGGANGNGADNGLGGSIDNTGLLANPVLSGFAPGLQGGFQGGFQGGLPMGMGGMGVMGTFRLN